MEVFNFVKKCCLLTLKVRCLAEMWGVRGIKAVICRVQLSLQRCYQWVVRLSKTGQNTMYRLLVSLSLHHSLPLTLLVAAVLPAPLHGTGPAPPPLSPPVPARSPLWSPCSARGPSPSSEEVKLREEGEVVLHNGHFQVAWGGGSWGRAWTRGREWTWTWGWRRLKRINENIFMTQ